MRVYLDDFLRRIAAGALPLRLPGTVGDAVPRVDGHFHLVPELFLQVAGSTLFRFPHTEVELAQGEALVVPPRLLHAEEVRGGEDGKPFCNVVIYAEAPSLSCHIAHEESPGRPGILHLEVRHHAQAANIHSWLGDAARLARSVSGATDAALPPWTEVQTRALVSAAIAGVLQALDEIQPEARPEPPLVARARIIIQNRLGDHALSVKCLAGQLGCTADYLSHLFGQTAGEHLVAYINRQRMERGARLLRETGMAGKEIAWACGFASQSYFIRNFRAHFGMTPAAWRSGRAERG
ncbi:helix-turn-helix transcriptional regulator [Aromatoleum petrolei]|uniref:Helix-turn-helix domain-containing protein n=1 Tax=Aromatoleum petrolei TaxID=76116 RepID=A0ABX1MLL0_9RHOO|nr:helix-turn-helix transcriptional regulator [Aromatoleum petrolei]NMF87255.1 helix-turn-helix domain-containing protein [Aromatoleum petrolei]QTQ38499.1 Transcriptional regulator, AraC family [Aromatoleum petrolei]